MFDHVVEALQRALDADDLVIDRVWLPWRRQTGPNASRYQEQYPGLILFRRAQGDQVKENKKDKKELLALLLVGETPKAGLHKAAFLKAVEIIRDCTGRKEEGNLIRVIGPYFSGRRSL